MHSPLRHRAVLLAILGCLAGCGQFDAKRQAFEAKVYGAALTHIAAVSMGPDDTLYVDPTFRNWPGPDGASAVRLMFRPNTQDLADRAARAMAVSGKLDAVPLVPGRAVRVFDTGAPPPGREIFRLSRAAFTAHGDSAVVYIEQHNADPGVPGGQSQLILVLREADGRWKARGIISGGISSRRITLNGLIAA
jgi:hypothetical protein